MVFSLEWSGRVFNSFSIPFADNDPAQPDAQTVQKYHRSGKNKEIHRIGCGRYDGRHNENDEDGMTELFHQKTGGDHAHHGEKNNDQRKLKNGSHADNDEHGKIKKHADGNVWSIWLSQVNKKRTRIGECHKISKRTSS